MDELWKLIGTAGNRLAADYVLEIFKVIRGYGGSAIAATQDISDFFALDDGKYGKAIINASRIKFILQLEEDEAFTVQKHLSLSDEETMQIIRNNRGEALLCANRNKIVIDIKASPYIYNCNNNQEIGLGEKTQSEKWRKENSMITNMDNLKKELKYVQEKLITSIQAVSRVSMSESNSEMVIDKKLGDIIDSVESACITARNVIDKYRIMKPFTENAKKEK